MAAQVAYDEAFDRNVGLLDAADIARIRSVRVGIGGMGGCGSNHVLTLARMGFERFAIADPDVFEAANLNRQAGATLGTLGQSKVEVMRRMVLDINPAADVLVFPDGIDAGTVGDFVAATDIGVNAIDFMRADLYAPYHDTYRAHGKYSVVGASPFAFGAAMTVIGPDSPSYREFFDVHDDDPVDVTLRRFVARMTPAGYAAEYLPPGQNEVRTPVQDTRVSSTAAALQLCTALTAAEVLFLATGRRPPTLAPEVLQVDLLLRRFSVVS